MSTGAGVINKPYASAITSLDEREIFSTGIIDSQDDAQFLDFMFMAGMKAESKAWSYTSFYNNPLFKIIDTTASTVTNSGSALVTVTSLAVASSGILVVGKLLKFPNDKVGVVKTLTTSSSQDTITIASVDGSNLTLTAGMKLAVIGSAVEAGSAGVNPERFDVSSIGNYIQIFNNAIQIDDVQAAAKMTVEVNGKPHILLYEMLQGARKHKGEIALTMFLGQISGTLFSDSSPALTGPLGNAIQTTRGLDQYITGSGINTAVASAGTLTLSDLNTQEALQVAARCPTNLLVAGSSGVISVYSDFCKNLPSAGTMPAIKMEVNGRTVDLEVEKFSHGGFNYNLKRFSALDNATTVNYIGTGSTRQSAARAAYIAPIGKTKTVDGKMVDYMRYRYITQAAPASGSSNGETSELMTGALAPTATSRTRVLTVDWVTNAGLEVFRPQVFTKYAVL